MIRHFCDICDSQLEKPQKPFVRFKGEYCASVLVMKGGHPATDICQSCIRMILDKGTETEEIATLQDASPAADVSFEPSLKRDGKSPRKTT